MTDITLSGYAAIGIGVVAVVGWLFKWWIAKTLDARFAKKEREDQEYRREQVDDAIRSLKGQMVMSGCLAEILKHMITGDHIEDLERQQQALEAFRSENEAAMLKKAAKYNLR